MVKVITCPGCRGKGYIKCPICKGSGKAGGSGWLDTRMGPKPDCETCHGEGKLLCNLCKGVGKILPDPNQPKATS